MLLPLLLLLLPPAAARPCRPLLPTSQNTKHTQIKPQQAWPKAMRPLPQQVFGYAAWGGVVGAVAIYMVQPWDWAAATLGLKKDEAAH
jgi:hypothetical protein